MTDFYKLVSPGVGSGGRVFVEIKYTNGNLSLTGVEGPYTSGNCEGSCGQITLDADDIEKDTVGYAPDWDRGMVEKLAELWDDWHLNDMRAGCEHQRAAGWGKKQIEVVSYTYTTEAYVARRNLEEKTLAELGDGGTVALSNADRTFLNLPRTVKGPRWLGDLLGGFYKVDKVEKKTTGWARQEEHPEGVLTKACPECGYKYGSKWLKEEVPMEVLDWLYLLPGSDRNLPGQWNTNPRRAA